MYNLLLPIIKQMIVACYPHLFYDPYLIKINISYRAAYISCVTFASLIHRCEKVSLVPAFFKT